MIRLNSKEILDKNEILKLYTRGCKTTQDLKISLEFERLPILKNTYQTLGYDKVELILKEIASKDNWDFITDNGNVIGLAKEHDTITLEPGSQFEISTKPEITVFQLKNKIEKINEILKNALENQNALLLEYGISPVSTNKSINLIPKKRYELMAKYLWGILSDVMMRETAGIQCCIDFKSEDDAMRKYKLANKLSPFMTAMFANSPIRGGVDTGYKTFRGLSWLNTDNDRCGFLGKISEKFSFEEYIECVIKIPMIFIIRENTTIFINGDITFEEFIKNGYEGYYPTIEDYELQANLCFPEVRMRNFIEIRNHDCVGGDLKYSIPAIYKGIFYNNSAMDECEELLKDFQYKDISEIRYNIPRHGMNTSIKKYYVKDYAKRIIQIAEKYLKEEQTGEDLFIYPIKDLVSKGLCPADILQKKWNSAWHKDINKLIKFLI